jgi:hypothetical protein
MNVRAWIAVAALMLLPGIGQTQEDPYIDHNFAELLAMDDFRVAYDEAMSHSPIAKAGWLRKDAGLGKSQYVTGPDNRQLVRSATCSPANCKSSRVDVFFDPLRRKAYVYLKLGTRGGWLGTPDTFMKRALEPLLSS